MSIGGWLRLYWVKEEKTTRVKAPSAVELYTELRSSDIQLAEAVLKR